jgi:predicted transcriptional regulator
VSRFFKNSHEALLLNILRDDEINEAEVKRLRAMLQSSEDAANSEGEQE